MVEEGPATRVLEREEREGNHVTNGTRRPRDGLNRDYGRVIEGGVRSGRLMETGSNPTVE